MTHTAVSGVSIQGPFRDRDSWQRSADSRQIQLKNSGVRRVLVIDDNVEIGQALDIRLRSNGYEPRLAHNGVTGLAAMKDFRPDVLIVDIKMPVMDGFAFLAELSRTQASHSMAIIVLSANVADESKHRAKELGATYYLEKPYDAAKLIALIEAVLSN